MKKSRYTDEQIAFVLDEEATEFVHELRLGMRLFEPREVLAGASRGTLTPSHVISRGI